MSFLDPAGPGPQLALDACQDLILRFTFLSTLSHQIVVLGQCELLAILQLLESIGMGNLSLELPDLGHDILPGRKGCGRLNGDLLGVCVLSYLWWVHIGMNGM